MPFSNFTNPYEKPENVPERYRKHSVTSKRFLPNGSYVNAKEDPVTIWAIEILETEYGVPLEAMELEASATTDRTQQTSRVAFGRADLIIKDDRYIGSGLDVAFIMLEAMEPGKRFEGDEELGWNYHFKQLNIYMSASPSARYAILTSGKHTVIYRRDLEYPRALEPIGDLPKYESAREAAKHSPFTVILNPSEPDGIQTGLTPLTRDKFREVLGDTRSGCHSILRDNEGLQPQEAVDAMVKFLFAKWYDEQATIDLVKETGESRAYVFSVSVETDPERLLVQVRETFEQAKQWERDTLAKKFGKDLSARLAFNEADVLQFKPHTTVKIVERLQPWSLRKSTADVKGGVFEDFLSKTFRDDLGQYFTPTPVINLMVGILQPTVDDYVGDPACGSARMLTHVLDYVRKREYEKAVANNGGSADGINPEEPTEEFIKFRDNHLFGAEYSRNVMHVARVNTLMNGAQYADLKVMDSLERLSSITGGITEGLPARPGFYPGGLTMILTNPPFGSKVTNANVLKDFAARDGVTKKNGKVVKSIAQEVAFVNRCLEFLAPKGKLAIVLPDGVLANSSMQDIRDWILRWARLKAVVSLPQATFAPYGAGVKTSIIFLEKREKPLTAGGQLELGQEVFEADEDYEVYMARIDDIGYDPTGRVSALTDEAHNSLDLKEAIADFSARLGW
ncbi:N-6 DNA methylase [Microcoleus sp. FACHB-SPT15]|uniref:HsdM family class I SAM-dependent methyltransferase n=1 Tax=Microcoleus sp. FACHB-SPT15 TaxID=2692830 RepID=UPI0017870533|nr:N-6 DNA methylase [Microcoleus sp. FACHB-SPT15]MBD1808104.1 N-6 DNA methylase [Microcoleus sp. FACHB-SPT15]